MDPFSTVSSIPAVFAASCRAASSISMGSRLTARRRVTPAFYRRAVFERRIHRLIRAREAGNSRMIFRFTSNQSSGSGNNPCGDVRVPGYHGLPTGSMICPMKTQRGGRHSDRPNGRWESAAPSRPAPGPDRTDILPAVHTIRGTRATSRDSVRRPGPDRRARGWRRAHISSARLR